jgi:hypothetical protein
MIYVGIHVFFNEKKPFVTVCIVYMWQRIEEKLLKRVYFHYTLTYTHVLWLHSEVPMWMSLLFTYFLPVRILVRLDPPHSLVCRKRRLHGAVLWMRPEKPRSLSQYVWHNKVPSLFKGPERWAYRPKFCNPSPAMVMSPYKRKILKRDVNL